LVPFIKTNVKKGKKGITKVSKIHHPEKFKSCNLLTVRDMDAKIYTINIINCITIYTFKLEKKILLYLLSSNKLINIGATNNEINTIDNIPKI
jgi:hypothetical protein